MSIEISLLTDEQVGAWLDANEVSRGTGHMHRLIRFWQDMQRGERMIWAAWERVEGRDVFLGHVSVQPVSAYPPFRQRGIPEMVDVWVEPEARRKGLGQRLLDQAIQAAKDSKAPAIGMGVGLTREYGAAHQMYAKSGFMPDGTGIWAGGIQAKDKDTLVMGPDVILMWIKPL